MTVSTVARVALDRSAVRYRYSDSGVVTSRFGGRRISSCRCHDVESPVRTATVIGAGSWPSSRATSAISARGASRFVWTSTASALSGLR
jgi:hypothetical protein